MRDGVAQHLCHHAVTMTPTTPTGTQYAISCGDDHAIVVELGGGLRSCVLDGRELLDGFGEHEAVSNSRGQVLAPWPNRIDGGRYAWDGAEQQLALTDPAGGNATHGLLRFMRWERVDQQPDAVELRQLCLPQPGYPFSIDVHVRYELGPDGLSVTTTATNVGTSDAPWASGQHPYLAPPGATSLDECSVQLEAATVLPADSRGIPLEPIPATDTDFDLHAPRSLDGLRLDTAFTDLARDGDGRALARLVGPDGRGTELWVDGAYPWLQLFTGDTLAPERRRRGLAVEPMSAPANAFNSGTDLVRLAPGASWSATWGMRALQAST